MNRLPKNQGFARFHDMPANLARIVYTQMIQRLAKMGIKNLPSIVQTSKHQASKRGHKHIHNLSRGERNHLAFRKEEK